MIIIIITLVARSRIRRKRRRTRSSRSSATSPCSLMTDPGRVATHTPPRYRAAVAASAAATATRSTRRLPPWRSTAPDPLLFSRHGRRLRPTRCRRVVVVISSMANFIRRFPVIHDNNNNHSFSSSSSSSSSSNSSSSSFVTLSLRCRRVP